MTSDTHTFAMAKGGAVGWARPITLRGTLHLRGATHELFEKTGGTLHLRGAAHD